MGKFPYTIDEKPPALSIEVLRTRHRLAGRDCEKPVIAATLRCAGFARYTGEGPAEAIAKRAIEQSITDQLAATPPESSGRNRFRKQFFRMIVAGAGKAGIEIAAPTP